MYVCIYIYIYIYIYIIHIHICIYLYIGARAQFYDSPRSALLLPVILPHGQSGSIYPLYASSY